MTDKDLQAMRGSFIHTLDTLRGLAGEQDDILNMLLQDYDELFAHTMKCHEVLAISNMSHETFYHEQKDEFITCMGDGYLLDDEFIETNKCHCTANKHNARIAEVLK